ncbi:hypothetical protein Ade02nite_63420 [Paractinoplanes deccanensis]|uniref:Uncharacterized protein n=1 Tax=Paractinoplanes deccanensis TaxID=113561 RepID=A0ABQ3YCH7_9ACTN|nr:hypothetical protein Ade02nite_63420 [Actinoplanes deccanensis]
MFLSRIPPAADRLRQQVRDLLRRRRRERQLLKGLPAHRPHPLVYGAVAGVTSLLVQETIRAYVAVEHPEAMARFLDLLQNLHL